MLEQHIDESWSSADARREDEVTVEPRGVFVDEGTVLEPKRAPVDPCGYAIWKVRADQSGSVYGLAEREPKE